MAINPKGLLGLLLWSQSMFLASTFRSWWAVIAVCSIGTLLVVARSWAASGEASVSKDREPSSPLPRWLRWVLVSLLFGVVVAAVSGWRIESQVGEDINPIYVGVDIIAHASLFSAFLIWVIRPTRGHLAMLPLGLIVVLLSVAAGGASVSLAAQTTVALAACLGFTLGSQIILGAESGTANWILGSGGDAERSSWLAPLFSLLTLSILMIGTSAIANATNLFLPSIQNRLQEQLQATLDSVGEESVFGGTRYVRGSRLGSIRRHMLGNPQEIALRAYCEYPPGYLRGNVFDLYRDGRWTDSGSAEFARFQELKDVRDHQVLPGEAGSATLQNELKRPLQRFALIDQSPLKTIQVEIHNEPLKGPVVFLPLSTYWMEAWSREVMVTQHGIVRIGVDVTRPYVAGVGTVLPQTQLSATTREVTTNVPASLEPLATGIAVEICKSSSTATEKAAAISSYFQREYSYSLARVGGPNDVDPLSHFLTAKHDAHCEFFASATVVLLRSVGVPARYVTGYVADEPSEEETEMWVARNLDAHAWAEAFDGASGRWFPVESTPGRTYQSVDPEQEEVVDESVLGGLFDGLGDDNDTLLGRALGWLFATRASGPLLMLFRIAQFPLFFVLVFVLWSRYLKPSRRSGNTDDLQSGKLLRKADRRLRKHSLVRRPSETLYQFADRVDQAAHAPPTPHRDGVSQRLSSTAAWYRYYADQRYQGRLPEPLV